MVEDVKMSIAQVSDLPHFDAVYATLMRKLIP